MIKSTKAVFALSLSLFIISDSQAVLSLTAGNIGGGTRIIADANGNPLPSNSIIRFGYFTNESSNLSIISGSDYNALNSIFRPLGEGVSGGGTTEIPVNAIGDTPGRFSESISEIAGSYFNPSNPQLYIIATNAISLNATPTQWAVFTNNDTNNNTQQWLVPNDDPNVSVDFSIRVSTSNVDDANDLARGTYATVNGVSQIQLAPVPEPTTLASVLLGGLALLRRRRVS
jgi:hypothetical protein